MSYLVWLLLFFTFWLGGCTTHKKLDQEVLVMQCVGVCSLTTAEGNLSNRVIGVKVEEAEEDDEG